MGVLDRMEYIAKIRRDELLTKEQQDNIISQIIIPTFLAMDQTIGQLILAYSKINNPEFLAKLDVIKQEIGDGRSNQAGEQP